MEETSSPSSENRRARAQASSSQEAASAQEEDSPSQDGGDGLHQALGEVYHDLNNSLSVISGNAQLLSELARAEQMDEAFTDSLDDIEAARAEISEVLGRLDRLRQEAERNRTS